MRLLDAGALGFKCFLVDSGVPEFGAVGEGDLRAAMAAIAESGAPLLAHAELPGPIEAARAATHGLDPCRYSTYVRSRPREAEDMAIALLVRLCRETGARVHVVHLSSSGALGTLRGARDDGLPFSAETTPHYLHFAAEEIPDGATPFKCAPPIRERDNREALWGALGEGLVEHGRVGSLPVHARAEEDGGGGLRRGLGRHLVAAARAARGVDGRRAARAHARSISRSG